MFFRCFLSSSSKSWCSSKSRIRQHGVASLNQWSRRKRHAPWFGSGPQDPCVSSEISQWRILLYKQLRLLAASVGFVTKTAPVHQEHTLPPCYRSCCWTFVFFHAALWFGAIRVPVAIDRFGNFHDSLSQVVPDFKNVSGHTNDTVFRLPGCYLMDKESY